MLAVIFGSLYPSKDFNIGGGGGSQPDFSEPDFGKINFHIGKIGKQFFADISLPDHPMAYVAS